MTRNGRKGSGPYKKVDLLLDRLGPGTIRLLTALLWEPAWESVKIIIIIVIILYN